MYALIMAGGSGTRFWPLSRQKKPKQFLDLVTQKSLLEDTLERIEPIIEPRHTFIATTAELVEPVQQFCRTIPEENIIIEPVGRNTAPCIGLSAVWIRRTVGDGPMAVLPSDHFIHDPEAFRSYCLSAAAYTERGYIVTLGITPTRPETGYGYLEVGDPVEPSLNVEHRAYAVKRFAEKPDRETALVYIGTRSFLWNSGMFFFSTDTILGGIERLMPDLHQGLHRIDGAFGTADRDRTIAEVFEGLSSDSIDYGVMERAERVLVLPASFGWSDVGSWDALYEFCLDDCDNFESGPVLSQRCCDCVLVSGGPLLTTIGVESIIAVATRDAVLVLPRHRSQEVRQLVEKLRTEKLEEVL